MFYPKILKKRDVRSHFLKPFIIHVGFLPLNTSPVSAYGSPTGVSTVAVAGGSTWGEEGNPGPRRLLIFKDGRLTIFSVFRLGTKHETQSRQADQQHCSARGGSCSISIMESRPSLS